MQRANNHHQTFHADQNVGNFQLANSENLGLHSYIYTASARRVASNRPTWFNYYSQHNGN